MANKLRIIWENSRLSFKALYIWLIPEFYIGTKFITPFFQIAFFALVAKYTRGDQAMSYAAIGNAVQIVAVNSIMGVAMVIGLERMFGTLTQVLLTPANRLLIFTSQMFFQILDGMFGAFICLFYGWLFFGVDLSFVHWGPFLVVLFLTALTLACVGITVGAIGMISNNVISLMNLVYLVLMFLCGVNIPITEYANWLRVLADCLPLTYGIEAVRQAVQGVPLSELWMTYLVPMLVLGVLYYALGVWMLKNFEEQNRKIGTLDRI